MKHLHWIVCAGLMLGWGWTFAQPYQVLADAEAVIEKINSATQELVLSSDLLRQEGVANSLREALVVRGVPVYILTLPENVEERASYLVSLSLAGAQLRLAQVGGSFLLIDRQKVIAGPLIGSLASSSASVPTILIDDASYAQQFLAGFLQAFEAAEAYTPNWETP